MQSNPSTARPSSQARQPHRWHEANAVTIMFVQVLPVSSGPATVWVNKKTFTKGFFMWVNPIIMWLLKSPFHSLLSKGMMLVQVTGRKSGRSISTPTAYLRDGNTLWVISRRESKWWRNVRGGAKVSVLLAGKNLEGHSQVIEDEEAVAHRLFENLKIDPKRARFAQVRLNESGLPIFADCERAAKIMVAVRIDL